MRARSTNWSLAALSMVGALASCEKERPRPVAPEGPRALRTESTSISEPATARPVVPVEVPKGDPKGLAALTQALRGAPTAASATDVPHVTSLALEATARGEARGMVKVGATEHARLEEGGYTAREVTLQPGDCITGIAHGSLGVMEVDAFLMLAEPVPATGGAENGAAVLAQDVRGGPIAVFGGAAGCYAFTGVEETRCKLVVLSRKGAGEVVFAIFKTTRGMPLAPAVTPSAEPTKPPGK